jgi:DNA polymerase III epsilon subunit-like protein
MAKTKERLDLRRNIPLVEACRLFGIDHKANHSAGPDAEACAKLMIEVIK